MDNARLALDYIEVLIWPSVVIAAIGIFIWRFRTQLAALIDRIHSLSIAGLAQLGASPGPQPTEEPAERPAATEDELNAFVEQLERIYGEELENLQRQSSELWEKWTTAELYLFYERTYRVIYGTQLRLLEFLRLRGAVGATAAELHWFFQQHITAAQAMPGYVPRLDAYMGYLTQVSQLVAFQPETERYVISPYGEGFLRYMSVFRLSMGKIL